MAVTVVHTNGSKQLENLIGFIQTEPFFKIEKKKNLGINDGPVLIDGETKLSGLITVAKALSKRSPFPSLIGTDALESAEINQWLDYCTHHLNCDRKTRLKELDVYLSDKVFFVNNRLTLVDILFFTFLNKDLKVFSYAQKESFVNLLRWFNQIQHIPRIVGNSKRLLLQRSLLY